MATYLSAAQWRDAATAAFRKTFADLMGVTLRGVDLRLETEPRGGAAVSWSGGKSHGFRVTLFLPAMAPGARLTRQDADQLAGYWVHEMCHPLFTDWQEWERAVRRGPGFSGMVNALEDIRIERKLIQSNRVPGAERLLTAITEKAVWRAPVSEQTVNNRADAPAVLAYIGRAELSGYDLPRAADMRSKMSNGFSQLADEVFRRLANANSTRDVYDIVNGLFMGQRQEPGKGGEDQPGDCDGDQSDGEGQSEGQGDQSDGEGQSEGQGDQSDGEGQGDQSGDQSDGEGQGDQSGDQSDGEGQSGDQSDGEGQPGGSNTIQQGGRDFSEFDLSRENVNPVSNIDAVSEIVDKTNGGKLSYDQKALIGAAQDMRVIRAEEISQTPDWRHLTSNPGSFGVSREKDVGASGTYNQLRGLVEGVGQAKQNVKRIVWAPDRFQWVHRVDNGKFDPKASARARMGHSDLYRKPDEKEGHSAAVCMLLDLSGSMSRRRFHQASMAINVAEAIEQAGCQIGVFGFEGGRTIKCAKRPDEKVSRCKGRLMKFAATDGGSTPLSQSILRVSDELEKIQATEHVLFAFTDGGDNTGPGAVRMAVDFAQKRGQRVVAIVMGGMSVKGSGFETANAAIAVEDMKDLTGSVLKKLAEQVQKARGN